MTSALPYHLLRHPRVLVLGAGAGADVLQAHYHGAARIDAVELNPQVVDLVRHRFADYAGSIYSLRAVRVHVAEARGFVAASTDRYDLIQVALLDSFAPRRRSARAVGKLPLHGRGIAGGALVACSPAACWRSRDGSSCRRVTR